MTIGFRTAIVTGVVALAVASPLLAERLTLSGASITASWHNSSVVNRPEPIA